MASALAMMAPAKIKPHVAVPQMPKAALTPEEQAQAILATHALAQVQNHRCIHLESASLQADYCLEKTAALSPQCRVR